MTDKSVPAATDGKPTVNEIADEFLCRAKEIVEETGCRTAEVMWYAQAAGQLREQQTTIKRLEGKLERYRETLIGILPYDSPDDDTDLQSCVENVKATLESEDV